MSKIRSMSDMMKSAESDTEALGYVIAGLVGCQAAGKGMTAQHVTELCEALVDYFDACRKRREAKAQCVEQADGR